MSEDNQEYQPGESYTEEEQQFVEGGVPEMESYNPDDDDSMMPYIPSSQGSSPLTEQQQTPRGNNPMQGFIDLDQLGDSQSQKPQQTQQDMVNQYQTNLAQNTQPSQPTEMGAMKNLELLESVMDSVEAISNTTQKQGDSNRVYATDATLKSLHSAITALKEIEYWIPEGKEEYVPKLKQIAKPIVDALSSYVSTIERLK